MRKLPDLSLSEFVSESEFLFKCQLLGSTEIVYSVKRCSPRTDSYRAFEKKKLLSSLVSANSGKQITWHIPSYQKMKSYCHLLSPFFPCATISENPAVKGDIYWRTKLHQTRWHFSSSVYIKTSYEQDHTSATPFCQNFLAVSNMRSGLPCGAVAGTWRHISLHWQSLTAHKKNMLTLGHYRPVSVFPPLPWWVELLQPWKWQGGDYCNALSQSGYGSGSGTHLYWWGPPRLAWVSHHGCLWHETCTTAVSTSSLTLPF